MDTNLRVALESQNPWWFDRPFATGIDRLAWFPELSRYLTSREILLLMGARRTGKSTLVYQIVRSLLNAGTPKEAVLYINLDEPVFASKAKDPAFLRELVEDHCTRHEDISRFTVCIDEVQNHEYWVGTVKTLFDTRPDIRLILTGSSSALLRREISTRLSGRYFAVTVWPLSFAESLAFSGIKKPTMVKKRQHFLTYLSYGGFPRVVLEQDVELKKDLLKNYYETIYLKDIIFPNSIRSSSDLYDILYFLIANIGRPLSFNRIADTLHIAPETVREYIGYAEDAFLFYPVKKFDFSVKKQLANPKKIYCIDTGIVSAVAFAFPGNRGSLLENAVFLALKKRYGEVYYHKNRYECDFLVRMNNKIVSAIQVSESLGNPDTRARELRGLLEAMETYDLTEGTIITLQESGGDEVEGRHVRIEPVAGWLDPVPANRR